MEKGWSDSVVYNLRRTFFRASVPKEAEGNVPEKPGSYIIYDKSQSDLCKRIIDIGETGPRPNSKPHGLRGRLASTVAHSASQKMAQDIQAGKIAINLWVIWYWTESKELAKELQDALITLFRREYKRQPQYNIKWEEHLQPEAFESIYIDLKRRLGSLTGK